ncbi:MAG: exopolyphosphatase [Desulfovibrio sp.]|nr:exopolyphosphatase [Desulfovibrio sp.]
MRLLTRSDFDGLICAVLLKEAGVMDSWKFVHPKDVQDGKVDITKDDILANVPYHPAAGMWFDHHTSEHERLPDGASFQGRSMPLPSCARVIWEYYGGHATFPPSLDEMLTQVDRVDSGQLTREDILTPSGWVLLGFLMDPRTGLGRYRDYTISNYALMEKLIELCRHMPVEEILQDPDVKERVDRYVAHAEKFKQMLLDHTVQEGNVLVLDLRSQDEIYVGNRFMLYSLFPTANVSIQIIWGLKQQNTVFSVGYSILNRTCNKDVGSLMLKYGGGGHKAVGTCQVPNDQAPRVRQELVAALQDICPTS